MTIEKIIEVLDQPENKDIHRIYDSSEGWCYITSRRGERMKLSPDYTDEYVLFRIAYWSRLLQYKAR